MHRENDHKIISVIFFGNLCIENRKFKREMYIQKMSTAVVQICVESCGVNATWQSILLSLWAWTERIWRCPSLFSQF